jgi:biopolymer transport protein ExbB
MLKEKCSMHAQSRILGLVLTLALVLGLSGLAVAQETATDDPEAAQVTGTEGEADDAAATDAAATDGAAADAAVEEEEFRETLPTVEEQEFTPETLPLLGFVLEKFQQGGVFMWPLLFASVLGLAVILERFWTLSRARVNTTKLMSQVIGALKQDGLQGGVDVCQRTRGPIAAILHAGLMRAPKGPEAVEKAIESAGTIEMSFLQRGLIILASIANVAPLMGFLGTVSGMIHAFEAIAAAEQVSAKLVATGISEALITTATGLMVAIPIQLANNFFISRIDRFVLEMEEASIELVDTLVDMESHQA